MVNNILSTDLQEVTVPQSEHKLDVSHYLFLLFWLLKPFYLWDSGSMQISDFIFIIGDSKVSIRCRCQSCFCFFNNIFH